MISGQGVDSLLEGRQPWPSFLAPAIYCCRVGNTWDKQHGVAVERKRLLQHTQELVARGLQAGTFWHTAQNAEHARPMLQVSSLLPEQGLLVLLLQRGAG